MNQHPKAGPKKMDEPDLLVDCLRSRRKELRLTMQQVADRAGLSVGFISQIERGITTPSLSSLVAVSRVLGLHVSNFLAQPRVDTPRTRHDTRPIYAISENSVTYERVSSSFAGSNLRSVIIHEPPGHRAEPISHEGEEILFILEGAITIELDGECSVLETGDSIHFPSSKIHSTWNHSTGPARILWTGTMDVFGEDEKGNPALRYHKPHHDNEP
jgi:transcriptional regulator with XRE-family HTH domain